ncbi:MAG TPA: MFS transporter [Bacteroidales bacterium]|jgi:MFS family permease|nr:MFS transporter [Bacteroidales bacterium]MBK7731214.1 MFS transporter [Bacteroidales bacterium]MBP7035610.1 MFS transporter [Bacteroidales bacterium]HHU98314.1 MFS transporter [Bacteroidales bacterium]HNY56978.1 MFS transporter [Bacteroidales bacterium]
MKGEGKQDSVSGKELHGSKIFGFERNILFTGLTSFLTDTSVKMIYSVMPMFLMSIGASKASLGLIEGVAESTASLIKALSGFWSDRIGRNKPFMLIGYAISAIVLPLYAFVISPMQVLFLRFTERIGKGIRTAPRDSLIAASVTNNETGKGFGLQKAMDNSGAIAGPLMAFALLSLFPDNYRLIFLIAGIPAIAGIFVIIFGIKEVKKNKSELLQKFRFTDYPKRYWFFLAIIFVFTLGNSTDALLLVKANEAGIKVAFIPLVYLITSLVSVIAAIPAGTLSDRIGKEKLLVAGFLIYAVVYLFFGLNVGEGALFVLFALYGLYSAATDGIQKAFVADVTDANKKGTALGIYNALLGITLLPASLIAGILYDRVNSSIPFLFGAAMALLATIMMAVYMITGRKQPAKGSRG